MKYGETLRQRSIPAWAHYNVDYDEIKRVIKEHTTPGNGKAMSIPGQGATVEQRFEKELEDLFQQEHRRVDLFVKTKSGEIDRRLVHLGQQTSRLAERQRAQNQSRIPARHLERYAKLEEEVLKIGQEVNQLSRYLNAQRTAFRKLLKKYRKWTGSENLQETFKSTMKDQSDSFRKVDVSPMFDRYTELLGVIRSALEPASSNLNATPRRSIVRKDTVENGTSHAIAAIQKAAEANAELDFDVAMATTPFGEKGGRAVYWVNPESTIELQVLLLRYMRLLVPEMKVKSSPFSSVPQSPTDTPARRQSTPGVDGDDREDDVGVLILDDEDRYAQQEVGKTVEDNEGVPGRGPAKAIGSVLWSLAGDAITKVGIGNDGQAARIKRKHIPEFLDTETPLKRRPSLCLQENGNPEDSQQDSIDAARSWLVQHPEVHAIAGFTATRTRFLGLTNNSIRSIWATLDKTIHFKKDLMADLKDSKWIQKARESGTAFPHHVLEVRYEGFESAELIKLLDSSHLTERVRGFSLETHAVWECCRPTSMPPPLWHSIVDRPIMNVPEEDLRRTRRIGSAAGSSHLGSTSPTSNTDGNNTNCSTPLTAGAYTSNTSAPDQLEAPALNAFRKKRRKVNLSQSNTLINQSEAEDTAPKYWNEYDHPEEGSNEDAFVIYVDPNASTFPGEEYIWSAYSRVKNIFRPSRPADEEAPLLSSSASPVDGGSESSEDEEEMFARGTRHATQGHVYGTLDPTQAYYVDTAKSPNMMQRLLGAFTGSSGVSGPRSQRLIVPFVSAEARHREREQQKFRLYLTSFGAATVILAIMFILASTSRHRFHDEVDAGLVLGVLATLALAFTGVGYMISRQDVLPWWHRIAVGTVFVGICIFDGMLLTWIVSGGINV